MSEFRPTFDLVPAAPGGVDVVIRYRPNVADYVRGTNLFLWRTGFFWKTPLKAAAAVGLGILLHSLAASTLGSIIIGAGLGYLILLPLISLVYPSIRFRQAQKAGDQTLRFTEQGVHHYNYLVNCQYSWQVFHRVIEGEQHFLLAFGKRAFFVLPKRGFASPADIDAFRGLATRRAVPPSVGGRKTIVQALPSGEVK